MEKKNAQLHTNAEPSAPNSADFPTKPPRLTPRQSRVLDALLARGGWIQREAIDRIAGASNGPQVILELRRKLTGNDGIEMTQTASRDRDGRSCKPGQYRITAVGRQRAQAYAGCCNG